MALAMITTSVFGSLGETPQQFEKRQPVSIDNLGNGIVTMTWEGTRGVHVGTFRNGIAVCEKFHFNDRRSMTQSDIEPFLTVFRSYKRSKPGRIEDQYVMMLTSPDGRTHIGVSYHYRNHEVAIVDQDQYPAVAAAYKHRYPELAEPTPAPKAQVPEMTSEEIDKWLAEHEVKQPQPTPEPAQKRDCVLVAAENLRRLEPISFWAKTIHITYVVDGKQVEVGHSVTAWKDKPGSNVKVIDSNGTLELQTIKPDLQSILGALEEVYSFNAKSKVKLLGRFDGEKEMQSSTATNTNTAEQIGEMIGYVIGGLMMTALGCAFTGFIGWIIGRDKGRGTAGFWLGFCLGLIGWIITICLKRRIPPPVPA
jgi:hypothetical protein